MDIGILGPLTVTMEGREIPVGAPKQCALLALLVLRRNEVVPTGMLVDEIWHDRPPSTAPKIIQGYVSQLRKSLGLQAVETRLGGYRFSGAPDEVDATRFEALLARGRSELAAGRPDAASGPLREALALWRGPALAEFQFEGWASDELDRLREVRGLALESRLEVDIALGNHAAAIPELQRMVREAPLRESIRGLLMRALYRSGRQADALAVYTETRDTLVGELGVEPGESLRRLQADILQHEPALEPTAPSRVEVRSPQPTLAAPPAPKAPPPPAEPPGTGTDTPPAVGRVSARQRRWVRRPVTTAACITLVAIAALGLSNAQGPSTSAEMPVDSVGFIDAGTGRITTEVAVPGVPTAIAVDGHNVWAVEPASRAVVRIDVAVGSVVETMPAGNDPSAIVMAGGSVWVSNHDDGTVSRISPEMNQVVETVKVGTGPLALAEGFGSVWVTNGDDRTVSRIDEYSGRVTATIHANAVGRGVLAALGRVWVTDEATGHVVEIDPDTNTVIATGMVGNGPTAITEAGGDLWVVNTLDGTVSRVDPATLAVTLSLQVPAPSTIGAGGGALWVGSESGSDVARIDLARGVVVQTTDLASRPEAVAGTDSGAWVSEQAQGTGHRGGRLVVAGNVGTIDPSAGDLFPTYTELAYDGLTATRFTGGSAGTQIVPDLALSLPEPADGGTTYTFRLRPGIRYSDGEAVQPSDFRLGLERLLLLNPDLAGYFSHVIGAVGCTAPPVCDLSSGVIVSGPSTVTFHLIGPDPRFLEELTLLIPTPQGTPLADAGTTPVPGTGPYSIADFAPGRLLTFERNPYFTAWAPSRPDGYPDEIDLVMTLSGQDAAEKVAAGQIDIDEEVSEAPAARQLALAHPGQVHTEDDQATVAVFLSTTLPPFNDIRVRRALNFAVDRQHIVEVFGAALAKPTCQILAPTTSGYRPYCPYTVDPSNEGQWRAPDLATARSLVAASGTAGQDVTLWAFPDFADAATEVADTLDSLGYHATVHGIGDAGSYFAALDTTPDIQAGIIGWYGSPLAIDTFSTLTCGFEENHAKFCNPGIDAEIGHLADIEPSDPDGAVDLAARIDREITDLAPWVPLFNPQSLVLTSARVGNYQSERGALLIDQLWVR